MLKQRMTGFGGGEAGTLQAVWPRQAMLLPQAVRQLRDLRMRERLNAQRSARLRPWQVPGYQ